MTDFCRCEEIAFERGYRVHTDGRVISPSGRILKPYLQQGYPNITVGGSRQGPRRLRVHRLVAYQKYGVAIYGDGLECRHLNGNRLDFSFENIVLGTRSENAMDKPKEVRVRIASLANLKHDYPAVREFYAHTRSYTKTKERFGISSSGTLHHILNGRSQKAQVFVQQELIPTSLKQEVSA